MEFGSIWTNLGDSKQLKWIQLTLSLSLSMVSNKIADVQDTLSKISLSPRITLGIAHSTKTRIAHGSFHSCLTSVTIKATTIIQSPSMLPILALVKANTMFTVSMGIWWQKEPLNISIRLETIRRILALTRETSFWQEAPIPQQANMLLIGLEITIVNIGSWIIQSQEPWIWTCLEYPMLELTSEDFLEIQQILNC